jgi:hypothetical protein
MLGRRTALQSGRGNAVLDVLRGLDDVRRAVFALLFEREYVGVLRGPVAANAIGFAVIVALGWLWLAPAFEQWFATRHAQSSYDGPALWLVATWLAAGPPLLDLIAGFAQEPIRRATERHMLGGSRDVRWTARVRLRERLQLVVVAAVALPVAMGLVLIPWAGIPLALLLGTVVSAVVWLQAPLAARSLTPKQRWAVLRRNAFRALGTGLGLMMVTAVPFANVLGLAPIATIAATSAYLHFEKDPASGRVTAG